MISEMKQLQAENARLKRMFAEVSVQNEVIKEALAKKVTRPSQRREMAVYAIATQGVSIVLACRAFELSQRCFRYQRVLGCENAEIADWLRALTNARRNWGWAVLFVPAQREGLWLEPQKGLPHLLRIGAEPADQAEEAAQARPA